MKTTIRKYFGIIMATLVLVASVGVGYVEHNCQLRGKHTQWIFAEQTHCHHQTPTSQKPSTGSTTIQKSSCCQDAVGFKNVETNATFNLKNYTIAPLVAVVCVFNAFDALQYFGVPNPPSSLQWLSFSSRFYGRTLLSFVKSFLI